MTTKIVVYVDGGNVQAVYTDARPGEFTVDVIDFDNLEAEGKTITEREAALKKATISLWPVYL